MKSTSQNASVAAASDADTPDASPGSDVPPEPEGEQRESAGRLSPTMIDLDLAGLSDPEQSLLSQGIQDVLAHLPRPVHRLAVQIVRDAVMKNIHDRWKGQASTTDVVTFDLTESSGDALVVELAICIDEARRQAAERGHAVEEELLLYVIHGLLHCCGYNDGDPAESQTMHAEEDRLLQCIGRAPISLRGKDI